MGFKFYFNFHDATTCSYLFVGVMSKEEIHLTLNYPINHLNY